MQQGKNPLEKFHSLPNVRGGSTSESDMRQLYSLSLSQLRRHSQFNEYSYKPSPFSLRWIYGYNHKVGVINLNDAGNTIIFYAASNCAVLYNWTTNQMRILQGHRHMITCIASDSQGKWLVTADSGPENVIIVWDSTDYFPQKTLFSPHGSTKIAKLAISGDAKYLLSLGYGEKTTLYWWIWSFGKDEPHAILETVITRDSVVDMNFNPYNSEQFLLMTKFDIWLGVSGKVFVLERGVSKETEDYELKIRKPENKISPDHGRLTCFTFVQTSCQILVATSRGAILIYGYTIEYQEELQSSNYEQLKFIKVVKIENNRINVIKSVDGIVVTGSNIGGIRFYDNQLKLLYWVHGFAVDSVRGISFNISPRSYKIFDPKCNKLCLCWEKVILNVDPSSGLMQQKLLKQRLPSDTTTHGKPFVVRDFIVCTHNQGVGFVDFVAEKFSCILDNKNASALTLTVHPEKPLVVTGYADGTIEMYNYIQHVLITRIDLRDHYKVVVPPTCDSIKGNFNISVPAIMITCLRYSPSGLHLACGLNTGELIFLDPTTMDIITAKPFKDTDNAIKEIDYTCDSLTLAFADAGRTVGVYRYDCRKLIWTFIGKHRSHYKDITSILFLPEKNPNGEYRLLSMGLDRIMVEYDIALSAEEHLEIYSLDRVDQTAVPLCGILWPTPSCVNAENCITDLPMVLMATDQHKYKIVNYATTMTLSTILGPRYEYPVRRMKLITTSEFDNEVEQTYLLFATKNIIGLQKMPLDGNPWKHIGVLGHPKQVMDMCFREDSSTLFTIGAKDSCMCQWTANYRSVETTSRLCGIDLDPYYCLMENGRPGWLFQEIRDLFYYIQILCQGTFSPAMRHVKDYIPIDSLPDLMRALGFFPSEYEVENLIVEAKYKVYLREPVTEVDFEEFVKLYINHRPALGYNYKKLRDAFVNFAVPNNGDYYIPREEFVNMLENLGEHFTKEVSWYLLTTLNGHSFEDRAAMTEGDFSFLPENINYRDFLTHILGVQDTDNVSEQLSSALESWGSQSQQTGSTADSEDRNVI